ncbi:hypothetical protein CEXT_631301 [Caerostris extrusa]|uniref:Uncharacterized protein n=1 Tax=Caerostris extrusa TaxID=172846 RepID=A0AAV4N4U7_CAEEX|nr:hypothetical protein CEXT_631301 [Caerostris extrusa]
MSSQWTMATSHMKFLPEPEFAEPIPNVTVSAGRDVSLPCVVDNLGTYRDLNAENKKMAGILLIGGWKSVLMRETFRGGELYSVPEWHSGMSP